MKGTSPCLPRPSRLYRGIAPLLLLEAPKRAIKFGANDFWGKTFRDFFQTTEKTQSLSLLTGCFAGATESLNASVAAAIALYEISGVRDQHGLA